MPLGQYPFIDVAVHPVIRPLYAAGEALVLFARDMDDLYWTNGAGAALFGHETIYAFMEAGLNERSPALRQARAAARRLSPGRQAQSFMLRTARGFRSRLDEARLLALTLADGSPAVLMAVADAKSAPGEAQAAARLVAGFGAAGEAHGTHAAVLDRQGVLMARTDGFPGLDIGPDACRRLVGELGERHLAKRPVATATGPMPAAVARIGDDPVLHLLLVVETGEETGPDEPATRTAGEGASPARAPAGRAPDGRAPDGRALDGRAPEGRAMADPATQGEPAHAGAAAGTDGEPARPEADAKRPAAPPPPAPAPQFPAVNAWSLDARGAVQPAGSPAEPAAADETDAAATAVEHADAEPAAGGGGPDPAETHEAARRDGSGADRAPAAPEAPAAPGTAFSFDPDGGPVRFVWRIDAAGHFTDVSPDFADAVGPRTADLRGRTFAEVAERLGIDRDGAVGELLARRDTWSGRTLDWPVEGTAMRVPVDLAALPTYTRDRVFDGFRGFGIVRVKEAFEDPMGGGLAVSSQGPSADEVARGSAAGNDAADAGKTSPEAPQKASQEAPPEARLPEPVPPSGSAPETDDPYRGEVPALTFVETPGRRETDKVVELERHRPAEPRPRGGGVLSTGEQAAFREIGFKLQQAFGDGHGDTPRRGEPAGPDNAGTPAAAKTVPQEDAAARRDGEATTAPTAGQTAPERAETSDGGGLDAAPADPSLADAATGTAPPDAGDEDRPDRQGEPARREADDRPADLPPNAPMRARDEAGDAGAAEKTGEETGDDVAGGRAGAPGPGEEDAAAPPAATGGPAAPEPDAFAGPAEPAPSEPPRHPDEGSAPPLPAGPAAMAAPGAPGGETGETRAASRFAARALPSAFALPSRRSGSVDEAVLEQLPLAILLHDGDALHHANREFLALTGYPSVAALAAAGGLNTLFGRGGPEAAGEEPANLDGTVTLFAADGDPFAVRARLQSVLWRGRTVLMLSLAPVEASEPARRPSSTQVRPDAAGEATPGQRDPASAERLRIEVEELRSVLETATDGVVVISEHGEIRSMNRSACALFDYDESEMRGQPFAKLFAHESQRAILDYLNGLSDHGVASVLNDGREVIGREASGGFIPLFMTIGRLSGSGGFCAVMRDITQWKKSEEELRTAKRAAETANRHKSEFLARVSHEIRTPLNAIIGFSEMMAEQRFGPIGSPRYLEYAHDIGRSGKHVLDIVNDLLDISKIEAGEMDIEFTAVSVNDALAEAVSLLQPQANSQRVIVRTSLSSTLPEVVADRRSIKQIALNLLSNAIRFTPSGGQIVISTAYEPNGSVVLRIRDTGVGMTRNELEQAMKPFRQVTGVVRKRGDGTGLGLPLTKAMVEANRAQFEISSAPGEGTMVEIVFPPQRVLAD